MLHSCQQQIQPGKLRVRCSALGWAGQTNCGQQELPPATQHSICALIHWESKPRSSPWLTTLGERRIAHDLFSITSIINLSPSLTFPKGIEIPVGGSGAWALQLLPQWPQQAVGRLTQPLTALSTQRGFKLFLLAYWLKALPTKQNNMWVGAELCQDLQIKK